MNVKPYRKAIIAVGAVVALVVHAASDGTIDATEAGEIVAGTLTAFGIWRVPNEDD